MKNKILIDAERTRYLSGISVICQNLLTGLHESPHKKLDFIVYGVSHLFSGSGYKIKEWKFWHKFFHLGIDRFQVIHIFNQSNQYFPPVFNAKKIVTLHDLNFLHERFSKNKLNRNINRVKKNLQNADVVVCISEFVKKDYLKNQHLFNIKTTQEVTVIYNGLRFPDERQLFDLGEFESLKARKYFLNIGVLFPKKNQLSILKALSFLEEDLVLVVSDSKKEYEADVLKFIQEHQLEERVHIFRNISDDEKYALIQNCEAMIHPSLAEGFGIPPIEAMHFGKQVFVSRLTSLPEIGGEHAYYFDDFEPENMAEKIKNGMMTYRSDQKYYSTQLKSWAAQFDYRKMTQDYSALYKKVLAIS